MGEKNGYLSVIYLSLWFILSMGLTILNKTTLNRMNFNNPTILSFFHISTSTFISWISGWFSGNNDFAFKEDTYLKEISILNRILGLSFVFAINIIFGNLSLSYCTISFVQIMRAIIPFITMLMSYICFKSTYSVHHLLSCTIVCVGVVFTSLKEISTNFIGVIIVVIGCFLSATKTILTKYILDGDYAISSSELICRISPISTIETFVMLCFMDESKKLLRKETPSFNWLLFCIISLSSIIAYFLNLSNFLATKYSSPVTVKVVGCVKQITTIFVSMLIFNQPMEIIQIVGMIITIIGSTYYSFISNCEENLLCDKREGENSDNFDPINDKEDNLQSLQQIEKDEFESIDDNLIMVNEYGEVK